MKIREILQSKIAGIMKIVVTILAVLKGSTIAPAKYMAEKEEKDKLSGIKDKAEDLKEKQKIYSDKEFNIRLIKNQKMQLNPKFANIRVK